MTAGGDLAGRAPRLRHARHRGRRQRRARRLCRDAEAAAAAPARGDGPSLIVADTYRFYGHNVGEAVPYRSNAEVEERRKRDPILRYETWLQENGHTRRRRLQGRSWDEVAAEVEEAVRFALASADPDPATALDDLFADSRAAWSTL